MHYAWQSLLWKEWHEHKWKLAALATIATSLQIWAIWRDPNLGGNGSPSGWFLFIGVPAGLFIAMGTAAGERSSGTLDFLRSLPIAPGKILAVKLFVGAATALLPAVPPTLVCLVWALARTHGGDADAVTALLFGSVTLHDALLGTLIGAALACMVYLWATAAGAGQPTELRAGLAAVTVFAAWIAVLALARSAAATTSGTLVAGASHVIAWCAPLGLLSAWPSTFGVVTCQLLVAIGLIMWLRFKFMRVSDAGNRSPAAKATSIISRARAIAPPFRSRLRALTWQHRRELLPSVLMGGVLIASFAVMELTTVRGYETDWTLRAHRLNRDLQSIGVLLVIIVGVGTFVTGLKPAILSFWRSRPITPSEWFWTRYATGAIAVVLILHGPGVAMLAFTGLRGLILGEGNELIVAPLCHVMIYTVAVCVACLLRHAVYAGIVTIGLLMGPDVAVRIDSRLAWLSPSQMIDKASTTASTEFFTIFAITVACITAALALVAWQAVRFDIGWKR